MLPKKETWLSEQCTPSDAFPEESLFSFFFWNKETLLKIKIKTLQVPNHAWTKAIFWRKRQLFDTTWEKIKVPIMSSSLFWSIEKAEDHRKYAPFFLLLWSYLWSQPPITSLAFWILQGSPPYYKYTTAPLLPLQTKESNLWTFFISISL